MGTRLPEGYNISASRIPVPGKSITEGVGLSGMQPDHDPLDPVIYRPKTGTMEHKFALAVLPHLMTPDGEDDVPTN